MRNHGGLSKLVYTSVALLLLASFTVLGCSPQATPSPTVAPKPTPTSTVTATAKPTPTATTPSAGQPQYGGTLRIASSAEADVLGYPAKMTSTISVLWMEPAVESLLRADATGNLVPWLATAYKADATAKTVILNLRKGVKFQDGTDFNATAVKWNLDQLVAAKTAAGIMIASVDVVDDYTVRVNLRAWNATFTGLLCQSSGLVVSSTAAQTNGVDWAVKNPVGTGPFKFVSWQPGVMASYTRSDGYWQAGKPYLDGVRLGFLFDDTTRELSFKAGEFEDAEPILSTDLA